MGRPEARRSKIAADTPFPVRFGGTPENGRKLASFGGPRTAKTGLFWASFPDPKTDRNWTISGPSFWPVLASGTPKTGQKEGPEKGCPQGRPRNFDENMQLFALINVEKNDPFSCCKFNQPLIREAPGPGFGLFWGLIIRRPGPGQVLLIIRTAKTGPLRGVRFGPKQASFGGLRTRFWGSPEPARARPAQARPGVLGPPQTGPGPGFGGPQGPGPGPGQARPGGVSGPSQARASPGQARPRPGG